MPKRCKRCGRRLKDETRDYGPVCQQKRSVGRYQLELRFNPLIDNCLSMLEQYKIVKMLD